MAHTKPMSGSPDEYAAWLQRRPESVQKLAAEFVIGSQFILDGRMFWLIGYTDTDILIVSPVDPQRDCDGAIAGRFYLCAQYLRDKAATH